MRVYSINVASDRNESLESSDGNSVENNVNNLLRRSQTHNEPERKESLF